MATLNKVLLGVFVCASVTAVSSRSIVTKLKLESMGIEIDTLTSEQVAYLASWSEGT